MLISLITIKKDGLVGLPKKCFKKVFKLYDDKLKNEISNFINWKDYFSYNCNSDLEPYKDQILKNDSYLNLYISNFYNEEISLNLLKSSITEKYLSDKEISNKLNSKRYKNCNVNIIRY
jgi:hypothetical protein